jgi:hypothetical protein
MTMADTAKLNGCSCGGDEVLHAPPQRILGFIKDEWKWIIGILITLGGIAVSREYFSPPASTAAVDRVEARAATNLSLYQAHTAGQFDVVKEQIGSLRNAVDETQRDVKLILQKLPEPDPEIVKIEPEHVVVEKKPRTTVHRRKPTQPPAQSGLLGLLR